jgi:hypothetical protein
VSQHWKHRATRCAVIGCESTRRKGWSTCVRFDHYPLGKSLYGAGKIAPIPDPAATADECSCDAAPDGDRFGNYDLMENERCPIHGIAEEESA